MNLLKKNKTEFEKININDKYFIDITELKNDNNYPNKTNCFATWNLLRCIIEVSHNHYETNFNRAKRSIIETQHDINNKLLPNVFCIETLDDSEFEIIINRLMLYF